jgi:MbtH protein
MQYVVLINDEGQHSIWPAGKALPLGWTPAGKSGSKDDCLQFIEERWLDIRPKSLQLDLQRSADERRRSGGRWTGGAQPC